MPTKKPHTKTAARVYQTYATTAAGKRNALIWLISQTRAKFSAIRIRLPIIPARGKAALLRLSAIRLLVKE